jgi:hypothetical protein
MSGVTLLLMAWSRKNLTCQFIRDRRYKLCKLTRTIWAAKYTADGYTKDVFLTSDRASKEVRNAREPDLRVA